MSALDRLVGRPAAPAARAGDHGLVGLLRPDGEDAVDEDDTDDWRLCSAPAGDVWVWPVARVEGPAFDEGRSPTTFLPGSGVLEIDLAPGDYLVSTAAWFASSSHRFPDMALTRLSPRPR